MTSSGPGGPSKQALSTNVARDEGNAVQMVLDTPLLLVCCSTRRRLVRAHRVGSHMEQVPSVVLLDHPTGHRRAAPTVLDPGARGDHALRSLVAGADLA